MVSAVTATTETRPAGTIWPYASLGSLFLVGAMIVAAWNVELPYYAYSPGPIENTLDNVVAEAPVVDDPAGSLLMLTVVGQPVNLIEAVIAGFDPSIVLVRREAIRPPDETDEEYRSRVLAQMSDSTHRAISAALAYLGYEMVPVELIVDDIVEGVPAEQVLQRGDSIVGVEGQPVSGASDLIPVIQAHRVGDTIRLTVSREGQEVEVEVTLVGREDDPTVPMIGITLGQITEPPFPIDIRTGDVGGPSAGLMYTLAIIDVLSEGDLTRGHVIAGTGTIDPTDGTVGAIGGVRQKVVAAEAAGASHILVPVANYQDALKAPRERIEIVPVSNLQEAVDFLESLPPA